MEDHTETGDGLKTIVTFRATDADVLRLQALAAIRGSSTSQVIRGMIRTEAARQIGRGKDR